MNKMTYSGANADRGVSWGLWGGCPLLELLIDQSRGVLIQEDFLKFCGTVTANVGTYSGGWKSVETTGGSIVPLNAEATDRYGVIRMAATNTDNYGALMLSNGNLGACARIDTKANGGTKLWLEARLRPSQITNGNWFFGLITPNRADAEVITNSDAMYTTATNYVGFFSAAASANYAQTVYTTGAAETVHGATSQLLVASTWYKLGMHYDPDVGFKFVVNGVQVGATVAASATNFPDANNLAIALGVRTSTTTAKALDADWVQFAQLI